jgi:uncharacterized surface protein with fasciclin (FAS1) repeats
MAAGGSLPPFWRLTLTARQKSMKVLALALLLLGGSPFASAQNADNQPASGQIIASQAAGNLAQLTAYYPQFSKFRAALETADLTAVLESPGPFTVFVPTDEAFGKMNEPDLAELTKPDSKDQLLPVLRYHIVPERVTAAQLKNTKVLKTVETAELSVVKVNKRVRVNGGEIRQPGMRASNGVIYVIDKVLIPADQLNIRNTGNKKDIR